MFVNINNIVFSIEDILLVQNPRKNEKNTSFIVYFKNKLAYEFTFAYHNDNDKIDAKIEIVRNRLLDLLGKITDLN